MKTMKARLLWVAALCAMVMGTTAAASAQPVWWNDGATVAQVRNFDDFLDRHPAVSAELQRNPGLANDPYWLARHPDVREYLRSHRLVSEELHRNPRAFMNDERLYARNEWRFRDRDDWRYRR